MCVGGGGGANDHLSHTTHSSCSALKTVVIGKLSNPATKSNTSVAFLHIIYQRR